MQDTIAGVEEAALKLLEEDLQMRVCGILRSPKDRSWRVALKGWGDKYILPADKGNVMERSDYDEKVWELLSDTATYCKKIQQTQGKKIS